MKLFRTRKSGFTLVEVLVVIAILGIVMGAIFSLYITQLKIAYTQDETLEMQQNLRMAMESISASLKNAGTLIPATYNGNALTALSAGVQSSYSSSVTINTASSDGVYARVTRTKNRSTAYAVYSSSVDSVSGFSSGDRIRLIRSINVTPVFSNYTTLFVSGVPTGTSLKMVQQVPTNTFATGSDVVTGDMVAKAATPTATGLVDSVLFHLSTGGSCPVNQTCLVRKINNGADEIIASYISSLRFSYIYDNGSEDSNPANTSLKVRAVRVTLNGVASTSTGKKNKQLVSLIMLRNKR